MNNAFDVVTLTNNQALVGLNPQGGYVTTWQVKNPHNEQLEHILYQGSVQKRTGIPVLFPYAGKAKDKKQHGFGREVLWTVTEQTEQDVTMSFISELMNAEDKTVYPFEFEAKIVIALNEDGSFIYTLNVKKTGSNALPLSPGLHPYFAVEHAQKADITIDGVDGFNAKNFDWNVKPADQVFMHHGKTTIHLPGRNVSIEDATEGKNVFKYQRIWSQTPDQPDFNFICVEPVYGDDFDIDNKPIMLAAGSDWQMKVKFSAEFM